MYFCPQIKNRTTFQNMIDISIIINDRIKSSGKSQAEIAKEIETTPSQLGLFLKGGASLSRKSLNKCLELLNIDLMMYKHRNDLAKRVAKALKAKHVTDISEFTQDDIITLTGEKTLRLFHEEDEERFCEIMKSGCIDPESTYNYMKGLISYYLAAPDVDKITNRQAVQTIEALNSSSSANKIGAAIGAGAIGMAAIAAAAPVVGVVGAVGAIATPLIAVTSSAGIFSLIARKKSKDEK